MFFFTYEENHGQEHRHRDIKLPDDIPKKAEREEVR